MERVVKAIPLRHIQMDRWPIGPQSLDLAVKMEAGLRPPPIHVARLPNGNYKICDGRHRVTAHRLCGRTHITAEFSTRTFRGRRGKINNGYG